jgi:hypothetical protein
MARYQKHLYFCFVTDSVTESVGPLNGCAFGSAHTFVASADAKTRLECVTWWGLDQKSITLCSRLFLVEPPGEQTRVLLAQQQHCAALPLRVALLLEGDGHGGATLEK